MSTNYKNSAVVCDANILIDYLNCDILLLSDLCKLFKTVHVPYLVLYEINNITEDELLKSGIQLMESPLTDVPKLGLSIPDWSCFQVVKEVNGICITNDRKLRSYCTDEGYKVLWGLETLKIMYNEKVINLGKTRKYGKTICNSNSFITSQTEKQFFSTLKKYKTS